MKSNSHKTAIIYSRVSTGSQAKHGYSLDSQDLALRARAAEEGYETVSMRDTASGTNTRRPELNRALSILHKGEAQALYALDIDRLARSTLHLLEIASLSREQGWRLVITSANVDTSSPAGEMFFTLAAAFAQYESRMISERVTRQHEARRQRGEVWGATTGPRSPLPEQIINRVVDEILGGSSFNGIARRFNSEHVPSARGGRWHPTTIRGIWTSPMVKMILQERKSVESLAEVTSLPEILFEAEN